jgi:uncharacterized Ntn-hydrolase superfamily protein
MGLLEASSRRAALAIACAAAALTAPRDASATYSILAVDLESRAVGGAVASCVPVDVTLRVFGAAPGHGAIMTQSYLHDPANADAVAWLAAGIGPAAVLAALTDPRYDPDFERRQYAVVDVRGQSASFTGPGALMFAGHARAEPPGFLVLAQGNILTGEPVLVRALEGFSDGGCDLAARLMTALEAAGSMGDGDARCVADGVPATSATIEVDPPEAPRGSFLALSVETTDPPSAHPIAALRQKYDAWRAANPCPAAPASSAAGQPPPAAPPDPPRDEGGCAVSGGKEADELPWMLVCIAIVRRALARARPARVG